MLVEFVVGSNKLNPLSPLLREVFLRALRFSPLLKNQHLQIPIQPGIRWTKNHFVDVLPPKHYLFIYLFICDLFDAFDHERYCMDDV